MKTLEVEFDKSGWHHRQLQRVGDIALYERWKDTSPASHYEVIEVGKFEDVVLHGRAIEDRESYPGASSFGKTAWTFPTLDLAQARFQFLTAPKKLPKKPKPSVD